MTSAYAEVPNFTPPFAARPQHRLSTLRAMTMFARDILMPFEAGTYTRPLTHRRILSRDLFICNSPELVREAFVAHHEAFQRKTPQMRRALVPLLGDGLFVSDGPVWRQRRALVAPIVHARHMKRFFPIMLTVALEWRDQWQHHVGRGPIDVLNEMGLLTAEIISRSVFGQQLGRKSTDQIVRGFARYQKFVGQMAIADMLRLPEWLPRLQWPQVATAAEQIHRVIDGIIDEHLRDGGGTAEADREGPAEGPERAMIAQLFDAGRGDRTIIDREGIRNEAIVLFMAGHETTANTLAWAWYLLSQADWARDKLDQEHRRVLGGRLPTYEDLEHLVFTRAVVEETLRLYPPVPLLGREAMCPATLGSRSIPAGSLVVVAPWLLHRNGRLWERPDDFVPERFLPSAERPEKFQYVPFAIGPRVCPGMAFGLTEAVVCLAVLAQRFDLRLAPDARVSPRTRLTLRPGDQLPMLVLAQQERSRRAAD